MAIPFHLPSDEETEDNYRSLDQLLLDLYHVLRQILMRPRCVPVEVPGERERPAPSGSRQAAGDVTGSRRPDLPDVVASAVAPSCSCCCTHRRHASARRRHRRRRQSCCSTPPPAVPQPCHAPAPLPLPDLVPRPAENWLVVGEQLRRIAEEFKTIYKTQENSREEERDAKMEVKTTGLFSLFVPAHFRSSIWTTVILLVGWRLLVRAR